MNKTDGVPAFMELPLSRGNRKQKIHKFSAVKKLNQSDMLTKGPLGWWMRKASVRSQHLGVRSQTCGVLEEGTLQKERENSRHEGSAV